MSAAGREQQQPDIESGGTTSLAKRNIVYLC
jgi:hypothetical protein